ncbi:sensor histidine kinase [Microterricola viridarii]|uniref:sensor histidine kinase n=1 Tax=Microterricola viridarii TaxID=412690 RepID=UPI0009E706A8|nr:histidine kinase [Microterricola viridarii]
MKLRVRRSHAPAQATAPSAPRAPRRPLTAQQEQFAWWAAASGVAIVLFCVSVPLSATIYRLPVLAAFGVGILQCGSLPLSIIAPRWATASWIAGTSAFIAFGTAAPGAPWPLAVPGLLGLCALLILLGLRQPIVVGIAAWALAAVASLQVLLYAGFGAAKIATVDGIVANLVTSTAVSAVALLLAYLLAQREDMRGELVAERQQSAAEQQRRVLVEERTRIARELHDVVAHSMSVIQVQASSAPYRLPQLDDATRGEFAEIAASARSAMHEMRRLLGVLRSEDAAGEAMPQPGLPQIVDLVPAVERAGVTVTVDIAPELPGEGIASTAAYRIAQESLSNVVRHAPDSHARVLAELVNNAIVLCVENDAPPGGTPSAPAAGGGHGLVGMRERCSMLGGTMHAAPTPEGGFRVLATLPLAASAPSPAGSAA